MIIKIDLNQCLYNSFIQKRNSNKPKDKEFIRLISDFLAIDREDQSFIVINGKRFKINNNSDSNSKIHKINQSFNKKFGDDCIGFLPIQSLPDLTQDQVRNIFSKMMQSQIEILEISGDPDNSTQSMINFRTEVLEKNKEDSITVIRNYTILYGRTIKKLELSIDYSRDLPKKGQLYPILNELKDRITLILNHSIASGVCFNEIEFFNIENFMHIFAEHDCEIKSKLLIQQSLRYFNQNEYDKAFSILKINSGMSLSSNNLDGLWLMMNIAIAQYKNKNYAKSKQIVNEIIKLHPLEQNLILNHPSIKCIVGDKVKEIENKEKESNIIEIKSPYSGEKKLEHNENNIIMDDDISNFMECDPNNSFLMKNERIDIDTDTEMSNNYENQIGFRIDPADQLQHEIEMQNLIAKNEDLERNIINSQVDLQNNLANLEDGASNDDRMELIETQHYYENTLKEEIASNSSKIKKLIEFLFS